MGDSIGDLILTPYITNLLGKDPNRCQMTKRSVGPARLLFRFTFL